MTIIISSSSFSLSAQTNLLRRLTHTASIMVESSTSTSTSRAQPVLVSASTQASPLNGSSSSGGGANKIASTSANGAIVPSEALIERALEIVDQRLRARLGATSIEAYLAKTAPPRPRRDASVGPSHPGLPNTLPPLGPPPAHLLLRTAATQTGEPSNSANGSAQASASTSTLGKRARGASNANGASPSPPPDASPKRKARASSSSSGANVQPFVAGVDDVEGVSCISRLNEYAQKNKIDLPTYESVSLQKT